MAMEARCYHGGEGRTRLRVLRYTQSDLWALLATVGTLLVTIFCRDVAEMSGLPPIVKDHPPEGTHRVLLTVSYDGNGLCGLAVQGQRPKRAAGAGGSANPP